MPTTWQIIITDSSVIAPGVSSGDKVYWTNNATVAVTLSNLPNILSPTPPGSEVELAVNADSSRYTVNGSKGSYTYDISLASPDNLPTTGTIDID